MELLHAHEEQNYERLVNYNKKHHNNIAFLFLKNSLLNKLYSV